MVLSNWLVLIKTYDTRSKLSSTLRQTHNPRRKEGGQLMIGFLLRSLEDAGHDDKWRRLNGTSRQPCPDEQRRL